MYLLEGPYNTTMLAPRYPEGYKGGYVYAGNFKLMHKLCITAKKVIFRPSGVLVFPEDYTLGMARYDRYISKIEAPNRINDSAWELNKILADKKIII